MDITAACRILDIEQTASLPEVISAKRRLLQALHPDKHPPEQKEIFARMSRDVIDAADFLEQTIKLSGDRPRTSPDSILEQILYDGSQANAYHGPPSDKKNLVVYKRRYASDKVLAVAVLGIDYGYNWQTNPNFLPGGAPPQNHYGCALNLLFMNRTEKTVERLYVGQDGFLVDDRGYQYSPADNGFYWVDQGSSQFNRHSGFVTPNSKIDGFVLYPRLRSGSSKFVRWFLHGTFDIDRETYKGNYDVSLA